MRFELAHDQFAQAGGGHRCAAGEQPWMRSSAASTRPMLTGRLRSASIIDARSLAGRTDPRAVLLDHRRQRDLGARS